jgi:hypothetical protein
MKMEQTEGSETLAFKLQTPFNHPEESIQHYETSFPLNYIARFLEQKVKVMVIISGDENRTEMVSKM